MGSAAFLMVEYAGIPYLTIIAAAAIPAILYYLGCFVQVHCYSKKIGLRGYHPDEIPKLGVVLKAGYLYFTPLVILVVMLMMGYTPSFSAVAVIFVTTAVSWTRRETMLGPRALYQIIETAIPRIAPLALACAAAGLVIGGIMTTGLGGKFMSLIFLLSRGLLIPTLLVTMVVCIILGMGMPVPSAYVLTAVLAAPALIKLGVPPLAAHLFIVYFAVASAITPPVAVAAYAASAISEGDPIRIALTALRLGVGAFLVPFLFALDPVFLLQGGWGEIIVAGVSGAIGISMIGIGLEGYLKDHLAWFERILFIFGGLVSIYPGIYSDIAGFLSLIAVLVIYQVRRQGKQELTLGFFSGKGIRKLFDR
jgi:TRAP transporter 4TM/12TM fusion protein